MIEQLYYRNGEVGSMGFPRLHITSPAGLARTVVLSGTTTIGRDDENDVVLGEATLSRCHAVLLAGPQGIMLIDLDSTNGTLVNGTFVPPDTPVPLADGDLIALGGVLARYNDGIERLLDTYGDAYETHTN
jgi:pSer/pThr/pTyr-binding forkhead associated (FHA) protein